MHEIRFLAVVKNCGYARLRGEDGWASNHARSASRSNTVTPGPIFRAHGKSSRRACHLQRVARLMPKYSAAARGRIWVEPGIELRSRTRALKSSAWFAMSLFGERRMGKSLGGRLPASSDSFCSSTCQIAESAKVRIILIGTPPACLLHCCIFGAFAHDRFRPFRHVDAGAA